MPHLRQATGEKREERKMKKRHWMVVAAVVAAMVAATGCTTAMRKTTPFYKTTAPSASIAAKAAEGMPSVDLLFIPVWRGGGTASP